jgi:gamma-glutamylcyclotransferase (GGCT)/AIG2-like uncharacterized protein YtfP
VELEDTIFNNIDNLGGIDYVASKLLEWTDRTPANDGVGDVYIPDDYDEEYDEEYNIPENMWGNTEVHDFGFNGVIDSMYNGNRGPKSVIATRIYEDLLGDNNISVFVYGTLKTNFCNNSILKDSGAKRAGENVCIYGYHMYNTGSGYPAVCETAGASTSPVVGEVWFVNKDTLDRLDILEGVPHLYKRESINTHYGSTYIYVYNQEISGMRRVTGGRWEK